MIMRMGILNIDLNKIDLDNNLDEDDPDTIILIRLLTWDTKFEKRKALKTELNKELMPEAWYPNRWWDWCLSEDEKKEISLMFIEELRQTRLVVYIESIETFCLLRY